MSSSTYSGGTVATSSVTLDAVNEILETIGEPPVTALDSGGTSDEAQAEDTLTRWRKRILRRGWFTNTLLEKEYTADGSDEYIMTDVLSFQHTSSSVGLSITLRDGMLYDLQEDRTTFPNNSTITLNTIMDVGLTSLPDGLRDYIILSAAQDFLHNKLPDRFNKAIADTERLEAKVAAEQEDGDFSLANVLETSEALNIVGGRRYNKAY